MFLEYIFPHDGIKCIILIGNTVQSFILLQ